MARREWTEEEDALLRATYGQGMPAVCAAIPYRSKSSIISHVMRIGISRHPHWTPAEDALLEDLWDSGARLDSIAKAISEISAAPRSRESCYLRADRLGFKMGCPDGFEYLTGAAHRCGFRVDTMRKILKRAGVAIQVTHAIGKRGKYRQHFVAPEAVDKAVADYMTLEPVAKAAARIGITAPTMRIWLRAAGIAEPTGRRAVWLVSDDDVTRAVNHRNGIATLPVAKNVGGSSPKYKPKATPEERLEWLETVPLEEFSKNEKQRIACARIYWRKRVGERKSA